MNFKFPKWTDKRNIRVFAGIEAIAKRENNIWHIKSERCDMCGKCCMNVPEKWSRGQNKETGNCLHLKFEANEHLCDLGLNRPFSCCAEGAEGEDFCSSKWELLK
jgi:MinD superfamily P-loop ATPase